MIDIYEKQNAWFVSRGFSGYSHGERAEISLRGPGSVKFFLFDTEADNDTISVFGKLVTETAAPASRRLDSLDTRLDLLDRIPDADRNRQEGWQAMLSGPMTCGGSNATLLGVDSRATSEALCKDACEQHFSALLFSSSQTQEHPSVVFYTLLATVVDSRSTLARRTCVDPF